MKFFNAGAACVRQPLLASSLLLAAAHGAVAQHQRHAHMRPRPISSASPKPTPSPTPTRRALAE